MAQPLPQSPPLRPQELRPLAAGEPLRTGQPQLLRGLVSTAVVGGIALGYLCLLVRASMVDAECHRLEERCEELRTIIATDMTKLSSISDLAADLDSAERRGLQPAVGRETIVVASELCEPLAHAPAGFGVVSHSTPSMVDADVALY